ncbi:MAG: transcriptional repressor [bacterium]|nr:transcriptional repressor [bacterium]
MEPDRDLLRRLLKGRNRRCTAARRAVLRGALSMPGHFEADDLLARMRRTGRRVSRGTVYRTLKLLVECGALRQVAFTDRHAHYERALGQPRHAHLICLSCGRVIEFSGASLERELGGACRAHRFRPLSRTVEVTGYCARCAGAGEVP